MYNVQNRRLTVKRFATEKPTIVHFDDGRYGIRKKSLFWSRPRFLDITDIISSRNDVCWRSLTNETTYKWCSRTSITEINEAFRRLTGSANPIHKCEVLDQDSVEKLIMTEKLKGTAGEFDKD